MFQSLADKVVTGVISLSMLLFSSYEGNKAKFSDIDADFLQNSLVIRTQLFEAFENDFEDIIKSGAEIDVFFSLSLWEKRQVIHEVQFRHSVSFQPMKQVYQVVLEERDKKYLLTSYEQVINEISRVEYLYDGETPEKFQIKITAYLDKMKLDNNPNEYDLMMLWNFKKPHTKKTIIKSENEI
jgi:hypothetical protein